MTRSALVTGASRGIGRAISEKLIRDGIHVLTPSRDELDLADPASVDAYLAHQSVEVDILVNNAGINRLGSVTEFSDADLAETLQIDLISPMRLARALIPGMMARRYGRIVNISSVWSMVAKPRRVTYTVSKSALNGFTRSLAVECAPYNILVNTVAPGFVNTELTRRNNSPQAIDEIVQKIPLQRMAEPEEIAALVSFLCGETNTYMTGQVLLIDGGFTCQ
jgi:3-oxoacyl-[acyl-carrier protein] reductase